MVGVRGFPARVGSPSGRAEGPRRTGGAFRSFRPTSRREAPDPDSNSALAVLPDAVEDAPLAVLRDAVQRGDFVLGEPPAECAGVLLRLGGVLGAGDGDGALADDPVERH